MITALDSVEILTTKAELSRPVWLVTPDDLIAPNNTVEAAHSLPKHLRNWAKANQFDASPGSLLLCSNEQGDIEGALFGYNPIDTDKSGQSRLIAGRLARHLPSGHWHLTLQPENAELFALAFLLGGYQFNHYRSEPQPSGKVSLYITGLSGMNEINRIASATALTRDLINRPANDMGPEALELATRNLADQYQADINVVSGDDLLSHNLPMIHAVGRAGAQAPRLLDLTWGDQNHPKVTLVGKGVCFDTGGLDIKPASGMALMKKDMGGAANVLGLAQMLMGAKLPIRLRVLIPAVENAIAGNAFRPGDVLKSRQGITVEIGNTDAEGRLVLADALSLADEESPELLLDIATLTGAARVALGPDLPPYFTDDETLSAALDQAAKNVADPLWRLPLWTPYASRLSSHIADINNITTDGFAGAITAALFLSRFVRNTKSWCHFDIYGWTPVEKPAATIGGAAQGIRALYQLLSQRYKT